MICEPVHIHNNGFGGCNNSVSVTFSDRSIIETEPQSPKRSGFFDSFIRRSPSSPPSPSIKKEKNSSWTNFFSKKSTPKEEEVKQEQSKQDEEMARFIEQLEQEGRSEDEIKLHLSFINVQSAPAVPVAAPPSPPKSKSAISRFFSEVQQVIDDIGFDDDEEYVYADEFEPNVHGMTVSISSAPFFGALPPNTDMTFEELASIEPVYVGSRCVNNLPACTHDGTPLPGDQTKCSVCLSDFAEGETLKSLTCVHFFHQDCIDAWLMVGHSCPLCKTLVQ